MPQGDGGRIQEVGQLGAGAAPVAGSLHAGSRCCGAAPQRAMLWLLKVLLTCGVLSTFRRHPLALE